MKGEGVKNDMRVAIPSRIESDAGNVPASMLALGGLCVVAFCTFVRGYQFGTDDQLDILPTLYAMVEPGLYARDWAIQTVLQFNVREYYNWLLYAASVPMGLPAASFILYVVTVTLLFAGITKFAARFLPDRVDAMAAAAIAVLSTAALHLGYSKLVNGAMLPNLAAYTLTAWSLGWAAGRRTLPAAIAMGFALLIHALVGVLGCALVAVTYFSAMLHESSRDKGDNASVNLRPVAHRWISIVRVHGLTWLVSVAILLAIAMPNLVLTFRGIGGPDSPADETREFMIWAEGRIPHHVLPHTWPGDEWYALSLMLIGLAAAAVGRARLMDSVFWCPLVLLVGGLAAGVIFVECIPVALVAKLMPFRGMCFIRLFWAIALVHLVRWRFAGDPAARGWMLGLTAAVAIDNTLFHVVGPVMCVLLIAPWRPVMKAAPPILAGSLTVVVVMKSHGLAHETRAALLGGGCSAILLAWHLGRPGFRMAMTARFAIIGASALSAFFTALIPFECGPLLGQSTADRIWHACARSAPDNRPRNAYQRFGQWASENTPADSLVLVAPWMKDFRYRSRRAVVVDARKVPYSREGLFEWQQRLFDVCGLDSSELKPGGGFPDLIAAFRARSGEELARTARRYGATHAALDVPIGGPWKLVHQDRTQRLYELVEPAVATGPLDE